MFTHTIKSYHKPTGNEFYFLGQFANERHMVNLLALWNCHEDFIYAPVTRRESQIPTRDHTHPGRGGPDEAAWRAGLANYSMYGDES